MLRVAIVAQPFWAYLWCCNIGMGSVAVQNVGKPMNMAPGSGGETSDRDLLDARAVCALFGGTQPIHQSTLYRGIRAGRYPEPLKIGPKTNRWKACECAAVLARLSAERNMGA